MPPARLPSDRTPDMPRNTPAETSPPRSRVLILATIFPPVVGGDGIVPHAIATAYPERVAVVAHRRGQQREFVPGCDAYDAGSPFTTFRVPAFYRNLPWTNHPTSTIAYNKLWIQPQVERYLCRLLRNHAFDVACLNSVAQSSWLPGVLRRIHPGLKLAIYAHGEEWENLSPANSGRRIFRSLATVDAFIAVSSHTRRRILSYGIPEERVHVVTNGVDLTRFSPGPPDTALLERHGLAGRPILLCLARLSTLKGQDTLIAAMPAILKELPETMLVLVGKGPDGERLRSLVVEAGLERSVIFPGEVPDHEVVSWYRSATVFAMPNRSVKEGDAEGFGLVFLEAAACGLAVVGGKDGGVPDAVCDGETGLLVDGSSLSEVAAACLRLLTDPALRAAMGNRGRAHALQNGWPQQAARFLSICDTLTTQ